LCM
jgi:hypothetical protein